MICDASAVTCCLCQYSANICFFCSAVAAQQSDRYSMIHCTATMQGKHHRMYMHPCLQLPTWMFPAMSLCCGIMKALYPPKLTPLGHNVGRPQGVRPGLVSSSRPCASPNGLAAAAPAGQQHTDQGQDGCFGNANRMRTFEKMLS
jgi:hypothetical protein